MKIKILVVLVLSLFCLNIAVCEETVVKTDNNTSVHFSNGKTAIGINSLPWLATGVSFRWIDKNKNGNELKIGTTSLTYDSLTFAYSTASSIEYTWFERNRIPGFSDAYSYVGMGIGLQWDISRTTYYFEPSRSFQDRIIITRVLFPVGVEHFIFKEIPNLSYSIEVNLVLEFQYARYIDNYNYTSYDYTRYSGAINISPRFYIHWYF